MNQHPMPPTSRREFLKDTGRIAAGTALAGMALPRVHAAEKSTIRLALIGCGGRGSGAAANAFDSPNGPVKLIAMADFFGDRLASAHKALSEKYADRMDVPPGRRFAGFDAWRKGIDCLGPGDVAMLCGYAGFRPGQLEYAVEKGVNVFMEKSFAVDPPAKDFSMNTFTPSPLPWIRRLCGASSRPARRRSERA